jgi:hypothetical protein
VWMTSVSMMLVTCRGELDIIVSGGGQVLHKGNDNSDFGW